MRSLPRSIASRYWIRSFVPMLKKCAVRGQQVGRGRRARNLDHRADRHLLVEGLAAGPQLGPALLQERRWPAPAPPPR